MTGRRSIYGSGILHLVMEPTVLFVSVFAWQSQVNTELVSKPFCNWKNASGSERGALNHRDKSSSHQNAVAVLKMWSRCQCAALAPVHNLALEQP